LTRSLVGEGGFAFAGIVTFGFACVAIFIAATVSGFIVPATMKHMARYTAADMRTWQVVIEGIFQINQAFAQIYSVAASVAMILWSVSVLRNGGLIRSLAVYGCILSALIIIGILIGHLRLNVHGMGAVWLGQAIWFIVAGWQLCALPAGPAPKQEAVHKQTFYTRCSAYLLRKVL